MKKNIIFLLTLLFLIGCSGEEPKPISKNLSQKNSVKENFIPIIKGDWILSEYVEEIKKTRSPFASCDKLEGVVAFSINDELEGDSIFVGCNYNNHEAIEFFLNFVNGLETNSLKIRFTGTAENSEFHELGYKINKSDTLLFIRHYNSAGKLIDKKQYSRVNQNRASNAEYGTLEYFINKELFAGNYQLVNDASNQIIHFSINGALEGLELYKKFIVTTDFMVRVENNLDNIGLSKDKDYEWFAYKIDIDTLKIFETVPLDSNGISLGFGRLKYKLLRK